jgi:hypothetical protein
MNISSILDSSRAFEFPAFEIVSCPPFDCADLLAEDEVRGEDAEEEGDGRRFYIGEDGVIMALEPVLLTL